MTQIKRAVLEQIVQHAHHDLPNEACGYLAGINGIITKAFELTNIDHSPEHFSFDPAEQFAAVKQSRIHGLEILANYHSHPSSPARPSDEDIRLAFDPNIHYFIVSLAGKQPDIKSFIIKDGIVTNEKIEIID